MEKELKEIRIFLKKKEINIILFNDIYNLIVKLFVSFFSFFFFRKSKIINLNINKGRIKPKINLDPKNGFLDKYIYITRKWDDLNTQIIIRKLKTNHCFLDIGSNIGYFSLLASILVKMNGRVIAFEPIKKLYKQIKFSKKINSYNNIKIYNFGLSDKNIKEKIYLQEKNIASSSIYKKNILNFSFFRGFIFKKLFETKNLIKFENIVLKKLDNLIKCKVDFIKIDVEGEEYPALLGMKQILKKYKPKLIIEISNFGLKKNYPVKIYEFLYKLKYDIYLNYNLKKKITINDFKKATKNEIVDIFCEKKFN